MALHSKLQPFADQKNLRRFNGALKVLDRDLRRAGVADYDLDMVTKEKEGTALQRFLSLKMTDMTEGDQWLVVDAEIGGRSLRITVPGHRGIMLPYTVALALDAPIDCMAVYRQGFARKKWEVEPEGEQRAKQLAALRLPNIAWQHSYSAYKYKLRLAHVIGPNEDDPSRSTWLVTSGYQGVLFGVGPKAAHYVPAAGRLEGLLRSWERRA